MANKLHAAGVFLCLFFAMTSGGCGDDGGSNDASGDADAPVETDAGADADSPAEAEAEEGADAGADADGDADADADAADGEVSWTGILCGGAVCDATTQVCCVSETTPGTLACVAVGACGAGLTVTCDGPEDCPVAGDNCCLPSGAVMSTYCIRGGCPAGRTACHADTDCPGSRHCCPDTMMGYSYTVCGTTTCP